MTECPGIDRWSLFLDDQLHADEELHLTQHLESCSGCANVLEELTSQTTGATKDRTATLVASAMNRASGSELIALRYLLPALLRSPTNSPAAATIPNAPQIPGYIIESELGRGGMGIVYLARHTQLNRRVALKVILAGQQATQEQVVRFLAEAQTCAALRHDHIVQIFDVGQQGGMPYYAMEYVEGLSLAEHSRQHPITPRQAAGVIERLARAMHAAHLQGVIHRDLKPANILVQSTAEGVDILHVKIADFGLAKRFNEEGGLTRTLAMLGTPDYMAPEQVEPGTHHIGPGVDIYALGAVLYFLLVGRPPFAATSPLETLSKVKSVDPDSPTSVRRNVPRDLSIICLCCLEKHPARRYITALAFADDLGRFLRGEPIAAQPITEFQRLQKWASRNPSITALAGLLVGVVLIALGLVTWQWYRAEHARARETSRANDEAKARHEVQVLSVNYALDQGAQECRAGKIDEGLQSFLRALELLPENEPALDFAIRTNLSAWKARQCPVRRGKGQGTTVMSVAFSPDGKSVLTGNSGNFMGNSTPAKVALWNADHLDGEPLWMVDHPVEVRGLAFNPRQNLVATGGVDGKAHIRDARTGNARSPLLEHPGRIAALAFSPNGELLATGGNHEIRLWNVTRGSLDRPPFAVSFEVLSIDWHRDGHLIAIGGANSKPATASGAGEAAVLDLTSGTLRETTFTHDDAVQSIAFQPGGELLATGSRDGFVRFWSTTSNSKVGRTLPHPRPVNSLKFSTNGKQVATASGESVPGLAGNGEVRVWDVEKRSLICAPQYETITGNCQNMTSTAFGAEDHRLAAVSENGCLWLWSLPPPLQPRLKFKFPERVDLRFSPDGQRLLLTELSPRVAGFRRRTSIVHLIDPADGRIIASLPHSMSVKTRFSSDSRRFMTLNYSPDLDAIVGLWDAISGEALSLPKDFVPALDDVHFLADGKTVDTVSAMGTFQRWNAATLSPLGEAVPCLREGERVVTFNSDGTRVLVSSKEETRLIALPECTSLATLASVKVECAAFTKDEAAVIIAHRELQPQVQSFSATDGQRLDPPILPYDRYLNALHPAYGTFLFDRRRGATSEFWDAAEGSSGGRIPVRTQIALHPSGIYLASTEGGIGDNVQLWSLLGKPLGPPLPHALVYAVEFSPNGKELVTSGFDGTVNIWPMTEPLSGPPNEVRSGLAREETEHPPLMESGRSKN